jgi:hypothetical protein
MTNLVFFSEVPDELNDGFGFVAPNEKTYEFVLEVDEETLVLSDCIGRSVPFDITQIDQLIDGLLKARDLLLVPRFPDAFISMGR